MTRPSPLAATPAHQVSALLALRNATVWPFFRPAAAIAACRAADQRQRAEVGEAAAVPHEGPALGESAPGRAGSCPCRSGPRRWRHASDQPFAGWTFIQCRAISSRVATQTLGLEAT